MPTVKQRLALIRLMTLSLPDDESALDAAKRLARRYGGMIVVRDCDGAEVGIIRPPLDS